MKKSVRLPNDVVIHRYAITLKPDLETFVFSGEEILSLDVRRSLSSITLHAADLEVHDAKLTRGKHEYIPRITYNEKAETVTFHFDSKIPKGVASFFVSFSGILSDKMVGFYRSRYEYDGKTHHMAVTQFESTDARRAFPCFDEPAHKSVFEVSLIIPKDRTAISNTIETDIVEHQGGYKIVKFAPSPKMSSYLVAFIVGHFEHIEKKTARGVTVRVFATPGKKHQSVFALDVAVKCIDFYEKYFGITYPLPLMDLIAIPDFAAGAMENWGAVTYRETTVLVDPIHSSTATRQRVALVIAHELAHQWFGNLVTMEWWTHLWLNEGFASYMEYVALNAIFPEWKLWDRFVYEEHARALSLDALKNTHAIEIDVHHPGEISEIFDAVSYSKGATVIRMLAQYLGETTFKKGLRHYLKTHSYANASTDDLWRAFEKVSGKPVRTLMKNWTRTAGYPLITVENKNDYAILQQKRYYSSGTGTSKALWSIPLSVQLGQSGRTELLMSTTRTRIKRKGHALLKLNRGEVSPVRVDYPEEDLVRLGQEVAKGTSLADADRFGLIRDAYALAESGHNTTVQYLRMLAAYKNERAFIVWAQIAEQVHRLNNLMFGTGSYESFRRYARSQLAVIVEDVGWEKRRGESEERSLLRSVVLFAAGTLGDQHIIQKAQSLFDRIQRGSVHLDPDLRGIVYALVAQNGDASTYTSLQRMYDAEKLEEEKDRILRALCSFSDETLLKKTLDFAFSSRARGQDTLKSVTFTWSNPFGRALTWHHVQSEWPNIVTRYGGGHLFSRFLLPASTDSSLQRAVDIDRFFKKRSMPGLDRTVALVTEQIRSNASWQKRDERAVEAFLDRSSAS